MTTNDNEDAVQRYLHSMRSRSLMLNDRRTQVRSCTSFCTSEGMEEWLVPLAQFIKSLSLNLSSDVAGGSSNTVSTHDLLNSRVIPIRVLLLELEQLNAILSANFSGASEPFNYMWVSTLLLDLGLSHQVVINLYMEVCVGGRGDINGAAGKCNVVKVITNLMLSWIRHAHRCVLFVIVAIASILFSNNVVYLPIAPLHKIVKVDWNAVKVFAMAM